MFSLPRLTGILIATVCTLAGLSQPAFAGDRHFAFGYEVLTHPKGTWEYEQWVTYSRDKGGDDTFDRLDFRHEIEYGVTDNFQLAVYLSDWRYEDGESVKDDGVDWRGMGLEAIYNFTHPVADPVGFSLYGETILGDDKFKLETKGLFQKNIDNWIFVYNLILEAEWEGYDYDEEKFKIGQILSAAYQVTPSFSVGAELLHEREWIEYEKWEDNVIYAGPAFSYRQEAWWLAVTPVFELTDVDGAADFEVRLKVGFDF